VKTKATVVGCGVIGLSTAIRLLESGYEVLLFTKELPKQTTSAKAAAFWFPYHVRDSEQILDWSLQSYRRYEQMAADAASGVYMAPLYKFGNDNSGMERRIRETMEQHRVRPLTAEELPENFSAGWHLQVPLIETPVYLTYLLNKFLEGGGKLIERQIDSLSELFHLHGIVINCSGLGARELTNDKTVIPVRGQVALLKIHQSSRIILEESAPTYIVYRTDGCVCGGTYEMNEFSMETEEKAIDLILQRCREIEPALRTAEVTATWAGLRPFRPEMRVEADPSLPVIHNYGHGGSGFTVSWGCAEKVVELMKSIGS
jgi:D-amino-acid oxidase